MALPPKPRALVTGAAGGLGREFCLALARRGGRILVADRDLSGAEAVAREAVASGGQAEAVCCDVSRLEEVERLAEVAEARFGGIDLLVNNAGVAVAGLMGEVPITDWEWIVGVNLWGVVYGCHVFVPRMRRQGGGYILNVASAAGLFCPPEMGPYNVTKAAVLALSETLAGELAPAGIGVTVLCPMFFATNLLQAGRIGSERAALAGGMSDRSSIQAADVARIALEHCEAGRLYAVPMSQGRWFWRAKRLLPATFTRMEGHLVRHLRSKAAPAAR